MSFQWGTTVSFSSGSYRRTPVHYSNAHGSQPRTLAQKVLDKNYSEAGQRVVDHMNTLKGQLKHLVGPKAVVVQAAIDKISDIPSYNKARLDMGKSSRMRISDRYYW